MALSGRALFAMAALGAALAACGGGDGPGGAETAGSRESAAAPQRAQLSASPTAVVPLAPEGPAIEPGPGTRTLDIEQDGRTQLPLAAYGRDIILKSRVTRADDTSPDHYLLWSPETGERRLLWEGEAGTQDLVTAAEPPWVATVRTELDLPFAEWSLVLRNVETGEERTLAQSDSRTTETPGLQPRLPAGFAPQPQLGEGRVAWSAIAFDESGAPRERVHLYDIATGETRLLFEAADPTVEGAWSVSIGGGRVAWVYLPANAEHLEVTVMDLATGASRIVEGVGTPFSAALSADGRYLAWDDTMKAKYSLDLETGERVLYAGEVGWGTYVSGGRVAWAPATNRGGKGGYYDFATGLVRYREDTPGAMMNIALVLGPWFAWQERPLDGSPGAYYFLPLD